MMSFSSLLEKPNPFQTDMNSMLPNMDNVASIILGGGQGTRLFPLTSKRCKPALNFGGRYLLIDIPLSNAIHSGCRKIFVLTQFLSSSLHRHIYQNYPMDPLWGGFIEILSAEQTPHNTQWFQGTADAVRKNLRHFMETPVDYFLILSGDQLYNCDFKKILLFATETEADLVVATLPIEEKDASRMGVLKIDKDQTIIDFYEKPQDPVLLNRLKISPSTQENFDENHQNCSFLGSMGIYLFKKEALIRLLEQDSREDFGKHLIPTQMQKGNAKAFIFEDYWEDIGTIRSFFDANMMLTKKNPPFQIYQEKQPIFSKRLHLPGPKILDAYVKNSILCEGCIIENAELHNTVLGPRTVVENNCFISNSYIMGHDFYTPPLVKGNLYPEHLAVGEKSILNNCIIDANVSIGKNVKLINKEKIQHFDGSYFYVRDGIIVVPAGSEIPDGLEF